MTGRHSLSIASTLVGSLIGVGVGVWVDVIRLYGRYVVSRIAARLRPLLRRWRRVDRCLRRWWVLPSLAYGVAVAWLLDVLAPGPLLPGCVSVPLGIGVSDGRWAVACGIAMGLSVQHVMDGRFYLPRRPATGQRPGGSTPRSRNDVSEAAGLDQRLP